MSNAKRWPIVYFESEDAAEAAGVRYRPGTCFPDFMSERFPTHYVLSPKYKTQHATKRQPLIVVCPGHNLWAIDCLAIGEHGTKGEGWDITGLPHDGTLHASPSINFPGRYHGWLHNGFLSDDCEGRKFTDEGDAL